MEQTPIIKFNKPNLPTDIVTDDRFWKENWDKAETKFNDVDKVLDLARLNSLYLSKFYKKMQNADTAPIGNNVVITCQGDSMTAGNGATTGNDYPNVLKTLLQSIARAGQTITVVNRGIGGNTVQESYNAWPTASTGDLCIIYLGTNDFNKNVSMESFSSYYQKIIEREIRAGVGVVLITPHKWRKADWMTKSNNGSIADYAAVIKNFGNKYNAPVLDLLAESRNLDISAYSSEADPGIHFNNTGYKLLAAKLTALLGFQHPSTLPIVYNNSFLSVRPSIDGIKEPDEFYVLHTSGSYPTPAEYNEDGIGIMATSTERTVHYSFYVAEDNLAIIPTFFFTSSDGTEKFELLVNENCMPYHDNNLYQYNSTIDRTLPPTYTLLNMSTNFPSGHANATITQNFFVNPSTYYYRYFPVKGWYTVRIKLKNCRFHGFDFLNMNQMKIYRELCAINPAIITR